MWIVKHRVWVEDYKIFVNKPTRNAEGYWEDSTDSNMTSSKPLPKKSHGHGCAGYVVKTTLKYLKLMGWRSDYEKYKTTEEMWNNGYKSYSVGLFD